MKTPVKISEKVLNNHNDSMEREQLRDYVSKIPKETLKRQNVNFKITQRIFNFDDKTIYTYFPQIYTFFPIVRYFSIKKFQIGYEKEKYNTT